MREAQLVHTKKTTVRIFGPSSRIILCLINFVTETEGLSSGCEASGVREEIARDYAALQSRLRREFSDRCGKLYAGEYKNLCSKH